VIVETRPVTTPDGPMDLYVARPDGAGPHPGLVVLMEAFGVNEHIKDVTRRFAEEGCYAVAPDLFHRFDVRTIPYEDVKDAIAAIMQLKNDMVMSDISATIRFLRDQAEVGKIGVLGYCFGGRAAYVAATRLAEPAAFVAYYAAGVADPNNPNAPVTRSAGISAPILLFFGGQDRMLPLDQADRIAQTLRDLGKEHEVKVYPQAGHGFFCDARESYDREAAEDAWRTTLAFLRKYLR
jgi:carboxymethylenebutenolidase